MCHRNRTSSSLGAAAQNDMLLLMPQLFWLDGTFSRFYVSVSKTNCFCASS